MKNILPNWQVNNAFWLGNPRLQPVQPVGQGACGAPHYGGAIDDVDLVMIDPLRRGAILSALLESNQFLAGLKRDQSGAANVKGEVIDSLGDDVRGNSVTGQFNVERVVYADTRLLNANSPSLDMRRCYVDPNGTLNAYVSPRDET